MSWKEKGGEKEKEDVSEGDKGRKKRGTYIRGIVIA